MADRVEHFRITEAPAGTTGVYTVTRASFDPGIVTALVVHIPAGHRGTTGIQIAYSQQQIVPSPPSTYLRGNKHTYRYELSELFPANGDWWVQTFNTGKYPHTWEIDFEVDALQVGALLDLPAVVLLRQSGDVSASTASPTAPLTPAPVPPGGGFVPV